MSFSGSGSFLKSSDALANPSRASVQKKLALPPDQELARAISDKNLGVHNLSLSRQNSQKQANRPSLQSEKVRASTATQSDKIVHDLATEQLIKYSRTVRRNQTNASFSGRNITLWTKSVPHPKKCDTIREFRFKLRVLQIVLAIGCFIALALASFSVNYSSTALGVSGMSITCLTAISSVFASFANIVAYLIPAFFGIPPHRHQRISRVECFVDLIFAGLWISSSSAMAYYGQCPRETLSWDTIKVMCIPWDVCMAFGYLAGINFAVSFWLGVMDLREFGFATPFTRGNWQVFDDDDNAVHAT
ncbi:uncharacterized protein BJ171DRAFT_565187 [Polychytrium aggregatum]|uniref:uncharacterized protein n=1 Tax=Polychytrium aggregatum TaxID=110093 RepID=UPI0022FF1E41|nr:uncharacterized protein BJ171DRAFT_565187 [Polychytrium aggregatum]KAI9208715.1 hypothetical protein BJ171DRAFT_565187 [Polychytrium aggregatum]